MVSYGNQKMKIKKAEFVETDDGDIMLKIIINKAIYLYDAESLRGLIEENYILRDIQSKLERSEKDGHRSDN